MFKELGDKTRLLQEKENVVKTGIFGFETVCLEHSKIDMKKYRGQRLDTFKNLDEASCSTLLNIEVILRKMSKVLRIC